MKNTLIVLVSLMMMVASCKDECKSVSCGNGACVDGSCLCDNGYEGSDCSTLTAQKFTGTYTISVNCSTGGFDYNIAATGVIETDPTDPTKVWFREGSSAVQVNGDITGDFRINFPSQEVTVSGTTGNSQAYAIIFSSDYNSFEYENGVTSFAESCDNNPEIVWYRQ